MKTKNSNKKGGSVFFSSGAAVMNYSGNFIQALGETIVMIGIAAVKVFAEILLSITQFFWEKSRIVRGAVLTALKYLGIVIASPVLKFFNSWARLGTNVKKTYADKGRAAAFSTFLVELHGIMLGKNGLLVSLFNIVTPIVAIIFTYNLIKYNSSIEYAVRLEIDGELIGYIENEQVFTEAEKYVDNRLNYLGSTKQINVTPTYTIEKLGYETLLNPIQIADLILESSDLSVQYAYGVYMNNALVGAVVDNSSIKYALEMILDNYRTGAEDEELQFVQNVTCDMAGIYTTESIIDPQIIVSQITSLKQQAQYYEVVEGDSRSLISDKLDMTENEIVELNPGFANASLMPGDKIQYSVDVPFLDVSITRTEVYEKPIAFSTEYVEDSGMYVGSSRVIQQGVNGVNQVTARVSKVNAEEINRDIIKTEKLSEPTTQIIANGTKAAPAGTYSNAQASYGKFIPPVILGGRAYISEWTYEDGGYYNHSGIDFAGPYGTPIYAGDGGTVVRAGWYYDYGYTVIIQHPNGLRTLYAHCSKLNVSVGESVSQGQQIANIGMTGRATGNHVHFEVIQGNTKYNPRYFLDGI